MELRHIRVRDHRHYLHKYLLLLPKCIRPYLTYILLLRCVNPLLTSSLLTALRSRYLLFLCPLLSYSKNIRQFYFCLALISTRFLSSVILADNPYWLVGACSHFFLKFPSSHSGLRIFLPLSPPSLLRGIAFISVSGHVTPSGLPAPTHNTFALPTPNAQH
jgi:hypothetical protein